MVFKKTIIIHTKTWLPAHREVQSDDACLPSWREGEKRFSCKAPQYSRSSLRLTKIHPESGDTLVLDMLLVTPEIKEVWETRQRLTWDKGELPVVSPEGLIKLKSLRHSGQDQDDIKHLRRIINED